MQTSKYEIGANLQGLEFRRQANEILAALASSNAGNLEPASAQAGTVWLDTSNNKKHLLKIRNKANSAWGILCSIDAQSGVVDTIDAYTKQESENQFVKKEDTLVKLLPAGDYNSWDFWQSIPDGTYWHIEAVGSNPPTAWAFVEVVSYRTEKDVIWRIGGEVSILHMNHVKAPVKWDRLIMEREFQCSKAQNGYTKLPNGLILQWGSITGGGVAGERAFPIAFPNIVLAVIAGNADAQGAGVDNAFAYAISKEKFYYGTKASYGGAVSCFSGSYIAIGC
ncbi:gp53-like domain-containing protein [Campylobacter concisus]